MKDKNDGQKQLLLSRFKGELRECEDTSSTVSQYQVTQTAALLEKIFLYRWQQLTATLFLYYGNRQTGQWLGQV